MSQNNPPAIFRIISWNCRGLGQNATVKLIKTFNKKYRPDILFLSETICSKSVADSRLRSLNFKSSFGSDAIGHSGGLWVGLPSNIVATLISSSNHLILLEIVSEACSPWFLGLIYGHPNLSLREKIWEDIANSILPFANRPLFLCGDFNQVLFQSEKFRHLLKLLLAPPFFWISCPLWGCLNFLIWDLITFGRVQ